ncbi:silent information regulator protein Sir2 [Tessaracoccus rhinocerotis]|uniref:Silent information regulator protein Sir2 n=1 Tax=Tessaracoccus rhinocerotis TaxID=1689449 RepID=A0A553K4V8_9ACTN|nr:polysaccharide lyase family 8 super-sandwich domain-containing protein [Tessaracoccus rhinocerotis]TRY19734.1 silent information regulator protein Sir2 [Tessaracoccus rhinocerotis]
MKRRTVLKGGAAASLASVVGIGGWSLPSARADEADLPMILDNFVEIYAGAAADRSDPAVGNKIRQIQSNAAARLQRMADPATLPDTGDRLFSNLPLGTRAEGNYTNTFRYLADIALATVTPGTTQFGDAALQTGVLDGIDWVHRVWYSDQAAGYFGNWYAWEIGIPTNLTRALGLLHEQLGAHDPDLPARCVATMDAYLRNGTDGDVDLGSRFHTGANLADITMNRIVQGALLGDEPRVRKAVEDQSTVFATIDPANIVHGNTDGYYADGSFIQHHTVAYTGSYGRVLLMKVMLSLKTLGNTGYEPAELVPTAQRWITAGFAPLIYQGYMMEIVKGRAVSRTGTGYADVVTVVEGATDLSRHLEGAEADQMRAYVKYLATEPPAAPNTSSFVSPATIGAYGDIVADPALEAANIVPEVSHFTFNAMERDVHLRPGYGFAVARSSSRISKYEYMSGENLQPWFQADGTTYLYLDGQDQSAHFGTDFYATAGAYALGGVTAPVEERLTVPESYGRNWYENPDHPLEFTSSSVSQNTYVYFPLGTNDYSGGVQLDGYGVASILVADDVAWRDQQQGILPADFVAYPNARGAKSYFMLDNHIVVLGADIGDDHGRAATSAIDARTCPPGHRIEVSGQGIAGTTAAEGTVMPWARWADETAGAAVGYIVLDGPAVELVDRQASVARSEIRLNNSGLAERRVVTLGYRHAVGARDRIAYVLMPGAGEDAVRAEAAEPSVRILRNDSTVQAVEYDAAKVTGYAFFGAAEVGRVSSEAPVTAMVRNLTGGRWRVAFSDPIRTQSVLKIAMQGRLRKVGGDDEVSATFQRGQTEITVAATDGIGRSYTVELAAG